MRPVPQLKDASAGLAGNTLIEGHIAGDPCP
jgi:hypothetical protein